MFSCQFVMIGFPNKAIFIFAKDYDSAIEKMKAMKVPGFKIANWEVEEIIEVEDFDYE